MDMNIVSRWEANKAAVRAAFADAPPEDYAAIVKAVIRAINPDYDYSLPDPNRVHQIDGGDYQGTLVFVIGGTGYQPSDYWYVRVGYGSCSGCDTLEGIRCYGSDAPTDDEVDQYMTLALHIVQGIKKMGGEEA